MKIKLFQYNSHWKGLFEKEKKTISPIFPSSTHIEHIGSTSIEGLVAKPIIDILIGIEKNDSLDNYVNKILEKKYIYIKEYEQELPFRRFFIKKLNGKRTHHIHMVKLNSNWWKRHISFRNYLKKNSAVRNQYALLKLKLSQEDWKDGNEYSDAKTTFIRTIEKEALKNEN